MISDGSEIILRDLIAQAAHARQPERKRLAKRPASGRSAILGRGMAYAESRVYQPGDEMRHIDWRLLARTGEAYSKQFEEERERPTWLWTDLSTSMWFGSVALLKAVQAAHLSAALGWAALQRSDAIGGITLGQTLSDHRLGRGRAALMRYLHSLATPEQHWAQQEVDHNGALQQLSALVKTAGRVHLISDFHWLTEHSNRWLRQLSRHNDVVAWQIIDPLEQAIAKTGVSLSFYTPQGTQHTFFSKRQAQTYRRQAQARQAQQAQQLRQLGIAHQCVSTHDWLTEGGVYA